MAFQLHIVPKFTPFFVSYNMPLYSTALLEDIPVIVLCKRCFNRRLPTFRTFPKHLIKEYTPCSTHRCCYEIECVTTARYEVIDILALGY